jgi:exosome complex exonuclease DIS3/RRP44
MLFADSFTVKKYVESLPEASQLLDLLAVTDSNGIEPTRASGIRQPLYPEVCLPSGYHLSL